MALNESRLKGEFKYFVAYAWKHLGLPKPTWVQNDMADFIQQGPRRRGILGFRGVAKSWLCAAFVTWLLWNDPNKKIMVVSASKDRADDFTTFVLRMLDTLPVLNHLKPRPEEGQRFSRIAFDVGPSTPDHAPSVKSRGISSQITGSRADVIIADDIEVVNNSLTQAMRDKIANAVKEFDAVLKPGGDIIYLGTPQCDSTIYKRLMERGYTFKVWPVMFPTAQQTSFYGDLLADAVRAVVEREPKMAGEPTDPKRFNRNEISERLLSYGPVEFARQFMLDTRLSDADRHPLRLNDLIVADLNPEMACEKYLWASGAGQKYDDLVNVGLEGDALNRPLNWLDQDGNPPKMREYQGKVMWIDPGGRGKDETGWCVVYMLFGMMFLMDAGGLRGGYTDENLTFLAAKAKEWKVAHLGIEANFGDGMFTALLAPYIKKVWPVTMEEIKNSIQKEKRIIDTLEPVVHQHRLIVNRRLIEGDYASTREYQDDSDTAYSYQLFFQFTRITRDRGCLRHDDRLDALAMAVGYFVQQIGKGVDVAAQERRDEEREAAMRAFIDRCDRKDPRVNPGWNNNWTGEALPESLRRDRPFQRTRVR